VGSIALGRAERVAALRDEAKFAVLRDGSKCGTNLVKLRIFLGGVAQLVERHVRNVEVGGSSPLTSTAKPHSPANRQIQVAMWWALGTRNSRIREGSQMRSNAPPSKRGSIPNVALSSSSSSAVGARPEGAAACKTLRKVPKSEDEITKNSGCASA
jgi:hypothetical protein